MVIYTKYFYSIIISYINILVNIVIYKIFEPRAFYNNT